MKSTQKKTTNTSSWSELYSKVVQDITQSESPRERVIKDALHDKFEKALQGKDFIIHNSCK